MKSTRILASLTILATAHLANAQAISYTGQSFYWNSTATVQNFALSGFIFDNGNTFGVDFNEAHTTFLPREDGSHRTDFDLFITFRTGNVPVWMSNLSLNHAGKLVNGGGNAETPNSTTGSAVAVAEYLDGNADGAYQIGEGFYYAQIGYNSFHTNQVGNGLEHFEVGSTLESGYVLAPNTNYFLQFKSAELMTLSGLGGSPTAAVTLETFRAVAQFNYEPVPEPGTMAALGLGAAALLRRKRRA